VTVPAGFALTSVPALGSTLANQRSLLGRRTAVRMIGRLQGRVGTPHSGGGRRERLARNIRSAFLAPPAMIVSAMAHSTACTAKPKERQRADPKHQPDPIVAKPVHHDAPLLAKHPTVAIA
jgi:hypothetical protein